MSASMIREVIATKATLDSIYTNVIDIKPGGSSLAIHNLIDPTSAQDAATKHYVDTSIVASTGASKALDNLASVAINTSLLPASAGSADLGSAALPFGTMYSNAILTAAGDLQIIYQPAFGGADQIISNAFPLTIQSGTGNLSLIAAGFVSVQAVLDLDGNNIQNVSQIADVSNLASVDVTNRNLLFTDGSTVMFGWSSAGVLNANSNLLSNLAPGVVGTDAVNMNQLQNAMTGTQWRPEVALFDSVDTTPPTSTATLIDGVTITNGMRVLFVNLAANNNEVYVATVAGSAVTWVAAMDNGRLSAAPVAGDSILVLSGTTYALSSWNYSGTAWVQFNGATQIQPGTAMAKSGNTLNVLFDNATVGINGSNQLYVLANSIGLTQLGTVTDGVTLDQSGAGGALEVKTGGIANAQVSASAAIAYSKLASLASTAGNLLVAGVGGNYVSASAIASSNLFLADGSVAATGAFNLGGFQINNMADPVLSQDAATKNYVDNAIIAGAYLPLAGGTMSGNINMGGFSLSNVNDVNAVTVEASGLMSANGGLLVSSGNFSVSMGVTVDFGTNLISNVSDPSSPQDAATKNYVDGSISSAISTAISGLSSVYLALAGGTMSGAIDMGTNQIHNVVDPTSAQDAATKHYVDSAIIAGAYLPLAGGTMTGDINLNSHNLSNVAQISSATAGSGALVLNAANVVPGANNQDLGSASAPWRNIFVNGVYDQSGNVAMAADGRLLFDTSATESADFDQRQLVWTDGSTVMLDWSNAGYVSLNSNLLSNVSNPASPQDAATKSYVDTAISTAGATYLLLAGGTMSGAINMGSNQINNMADPTSAQDAVTLHYLNGALSMSPAWQKFTVAYSALAAGGSTSSITLFSLGAKQVIHGVVVKHSVSFSGGTLSGYTVSVGVASDVARYSSAFDVFQAVGSSTAQASDDLSPEDFSSATNITITASSFGDLLSSVTAGSVDVWVAVSTLN